MGVIKSEGADLSNKMFVKFLCLFFHSPLHVVLFAAATGALGVSVLATQVNGLTAALG